ncbi:MAG: pectin esterase [Sphingobacteriaceae bacterium]|jgi:pectinesterase|nr:pectin esterase [Sphingobacteriaceae bacterium]
MRSFIALLLIFSTAIATRAQQGAYPTSLTVALDGSGNFETIQEAINSTRDLGISRVTIHIKKGIYHEKIIVPSWKTNISLIGDDKENTIISNADYSGKLFPGGKDAIGKDKFSTFNSYTLLVQGDGFTAENLTIENTAGRFGQAVALHVEGDKAIIRNCRILGNQDTLYTATSNSRQYYVDCYIEGTTDFIFGEATTVFQSCTIKSLTHSYITAAATSSAQKFGYVFFDCKLIAAPEVKQVYLGRPWRPYAKTVFIRTEMGAHIIPAGWDPWNGDAMFPNKDKTAFYAEYKSSGAGANAMQRASWSKQLKKKEARKYTFENIFLGTSAWKPNLHE